MPKQTITDVPPTVPSFPTFSRAVISNRTVYVSGCIGCDNEHNILGGLQYQARAALENMKTILEGVGSGLEHVVKVNVYLAYLARDFDAFNEIYIDFFNGVDLPARTCVGVAALPMGAFVEVDCIAELSGVA